MATSVLPGQVVGRQPAAGVADLDVAPRAGRRPLPKEWPLVALFAGYPVWWLLGITEVASTVFCGVMLVSLLRSRPIRLPRGYWLWALFLVWVAVGILVAQTDAPGAVAGVNTGRYLTWAYRTLWYLRGTVILLFVGNLLSRGGLYRVTRALSWMFIWTTIGGLLGVLYPLANFPSFLELVMPGLDSNFFLRSVIHPGLAEIQTIIGAERGRPSAPFPFANIWGLNYAVYLPFFLHGWLGPEAGRRRWFAVPLLAASVVPVIFSLNRALWFALILVAVLLAVRALCFGQARPAIAVAGAGALVAMMIVATPLGGLVTARFDNPNSNEGRGNLAALGAESVTEASPVIGFGTTRDVQGSFNSIAEGSTPRCPRCSPPSLGTQGQLSLVSFSQGWGGIVLYLSFMLLAALRSVRVRSPAVTIGLAVLGLHLATMFVYSADNLALLGIMAAVALLWRFAPDPADARRDSRPTRLPIDTLGGALAFLRRHAVVIVAGVIVGVLAGMVLQQRQGIRYEGSASVLLPAAPAYPGSLGPPYSIDTEAQLLYTTEVTAAVTKAAPRAVAAGTTVQITARVNTRILNLSFQAADRTGALRAVTAAADTLLTQRDTQLQARQKLALQILADRSASLTTALGTVDTASRALEGTANTRQRLLLRERYRVLAAMEQANSQAARVSSLPLSAGRVLAPPDVHLKRDARFVRPASGLVLGLGLGLAAAWLLDAISGGRSSTRPLLRAALRPLFPRRRRRVRRPVPA